jgi:hypothetical protein
MSVDAALAIREVIPGLLLRVAIRTHNHFDATAYLVAQPFLAATESGAVGP